MRRSQLLAKLGITTLDSEESEWEEKVEPPKSLDAEAELRELLENFKDNKDEIVRNYEGIIYPDGRSPNLPGDWDATREDPEARKEWLKVFIVSLTYRFGKRFPNRPETFWPNVKVREDSKPSPIHTLPAEWMDLLDKMINHQDENNQRYFLVDIQLSGLLQNLQVLGCLRTHLPWDASSGILKY